MYDTIHPLFDLLLAHKLSANEDSVVVEALLLSIDAARRILAIILVVHQGVVVLVIHRAVGYKLDEVFKVLQELQFDIDHTLDLVVLYELQNFAQGHGLPGDHGAQVQRINLKLVLKINFIELVGVLALVKLHFYFEEHFVFLEALVVYIDIEVLLYLVPLLSFLYVLFYIGIDITDTAQCLRLVDDAPRPNMDTLGLPIFIEVADLLVMLFEVVQ